MLISGQGIGNDEAGSSSFLAARWNHLGQILISATLRSQFNQNR